VIRPRSPYGFGPTEQALLDGLLWNSRFRWMVGEYTDASSPYGYLVNKDGRLDWDARQTLEYEREYNDRYSGNTAERMRQRLLPPGIEPMFPVPVPERYKPDYDLFLIKLVAMHFMLTVTELGFTETGGLGSAGYHEGQEDVLFRRARMPDLRWFGDFVTMLAHTHRKMNPDLEFAFMGLDSEDEAADDAVWQGRVGTARATLNEDRARVGLPAYEFPEADMPMLQPARGIVFIKDASKIAESGILIEPASEKPDVAEPGETPVSPNPSDRRPIAPANGSAKGVNPQVELEVDEDIELAKAELQIYRRWVAKHSGAARKFEFEHLTPVLAAMLEPGVLDDGRVVFKAGDAGPKDTRSAVSV
jgi:hypothetical protein